VKINFFFIILKKGIRVDTEDQDDQDTLNTEQKDDKYIEQWKKLNDESG
jgi:hypothetical protein